MRDNKKGRKLHKTNNEIRHKTIRLVGDYNGIIVSNSEAKEMAGDLDLVLISEQDGVGICKIIDYKKFMFEANKKPKQPKVKPMKEMRYTPNIGDSDFDFKLRHVINFLDKGHKVKAYVFFRGREMAFRDKGEAILLKLSIAIEDVGTPEGLPKHEGRKCTIIFKPKK